MPKLTSHVLSVTCSDDSPKVKSVWKVFRYVSNKHCGVHAVRMPSVSHWVMEPLEPNKMTTIFETRRKVVIRTQYTPTINFFYKHTIGYTRKTTFIELNIYIHTYIFLPTLPKSTPNTFGVTLVAIATG